MICVTIRFAIVGCLVLASQRTTNAEERLVASEPLVLRHPAINKSIGNPVHCLSFVNGDALLVTGATSGVHLWDPSSGELKQTLDVDERSVDAIVQDPRGTHLVAGGAQGVIKVWEAHTFKPLATLGPTAGAIRSLSISSDAKLLASVSPNPPSVATNERFGLLLWDLATGRQLRRIDHPPPAFGSTVVAFLPDGKQLISAQDRTFRLIDVQKGAISKTIDMPELPRTIQCLAISREGRLATGVFEAKLRLWNTIDWKQILAWDAHDKPAPPRRGVSTVCFSPDGKYLLSGGLDGHVCVWDASTGRQLLELDGSGEQTSGWITGVAITADNRLLAATHFGGTATLWRLRKAE
ncbi:WD domain, G-beta repeat [Anatilimnocola aggregata]|uniref:WD domain, G-beta repeat n=1 Tax=Anatilimnocola aggregata TaxID=2528021 RepID=A0A517YA19_9BACT|nr:hypothetical protein [Anatilimnocola aggregata]QDU27079.1 WD domain, G-beta repeat [Anatilimnocola aggregata]